MPWLAISIPQPVTSCRCGLEGVIRNVANVDSVFLRLALGCNARIFGLIGKYGMLAHHAIAIGGQEAVDRPWFVAPMQGGGTWQDGVDGANDSIFFQA